MEKKFVPTYTPDDIDKLLEACADSEYNEPEIRKALTARNRAIVTLASFCTQIVTFWAIDQIAAAAPAYLALSGYVACYEAEPLFQHALHYGRLWYRMDQHHVTDDYEVQRAPSSFTRRDIADFIKRIVRPSDDREAMYYPLSYRIGLVVGWLSALAVSQRDDAHAGLALLTGYVLPLLPVAPGRVQRKATSAKKSAPLKKVGRVLQKSKR